MGKKSLIKSTDKKNDKDKAAKAASTKGKKAAQKGKAKKTASAPTAQKAKKSDAQAKPKEAPAQKQAPAAKEAPSQKASPPAQKSEQKAQKVSISSLLKRKFSPIGPLPKPISMPAPKRPKPSTSADAPVENRAVLFRKFDMDEINKAAKAPAVEKKKPVKAQAPAKEASLAGQEKDMSVNETDPVQEPDQDSVQDSIQDPGQDLEKELDFYEPTVWEQTTAYVDSFFESAQKGLFAFLGFFNEMLYGVKKSVRQQDSDKKNASMILGAAILGALLFMLLVTSYLNAGRYYFVPTQDGYEMYKGRFAPMGKQKVEVFPDLGFAEAPKDFYSAKAAHDIAKIYFLAQADHYLKDLELPDYESARESLRQALAYAPTFKERALIQSRINRLDFERLVIEADQALVENASQSINKARSLLDQAAQIAQTPEQKALLLEERRRISAALEALKN